MTRTDPRRMVVDGVEYVTTTDAIERLGPDVTADVLRSWRRRGLVRVAVDPEGQPVKLPSPTGLQYVLRWDDVVEAEHATRTSRQGRKRSA